MNSQNNYKINKFSLFPLYGWCINSQPRFDFSKNSPEKIDYKINKIYGINKSVKLNKQKEKNPFYALGLGRYIDLKV